MGFQLYPDHALIALIGRGPGIYVLEHPPIPFLHAITISHDNKPTPGTAKSEESPKSTKAESKSETRRLLLAAVVRLLPLGVLRVVQQETLPPNVQ